MNSTRNKKIVICIISIIVCIILNYYLSTLQSCFFNICLLLLAIAFVLVKTIKVPGMSDIIPVVSGSIYQIINKVLSQSIAATPIKEFWETIVNYFLLKLGINKTYVISERIGISISFFVFFLVLLFLCNKDDQTAMKVHRKSQPLFESDNYIRESSLFCQNLIQRINRMNSDYGWDENDFTSLDAEVELNINGKRRKKYVDLFNCLKKSKIKNGVYLVLGEPGSGKSVALRKLCSNLLGESKKTGKIPVYINLKNWSNNWNMDNLPQKRDLNDFIKQELCGDGDDKASKFVNQYFDIIQDDGRWYYVFDSFDELPCLLGDNVSNELIERITNLLYDYMTGAGQIGGIIASRLSKCPSSTNGNYIVLKIKAFDNRKMRKAFKKFIGAPYRTIIKRIFTEREDLVPLCRNPFYLSLIRLYLDKHNLDLPQNQMDLFDSFIESVLEKHEGKIRKKNTCIEEVQKSAMILASSMETDAFGLEYPIDILLSKDKEFWEKHLLLLEYCRLCRIGNHKKTITFIHRRFQEYFLVKHYINNDMIDEKSIVDTISNSGGKRDALALYCEVADIKLVTIIAEHCFNIIKANFDYSRDISNDKCLTLINSLYFMREAFKNRKYILNDKIDEFEKMISELLIPETDLIVQVALTNCIVLFDSDRIKDLSIKIFKLKNKWLNDIVIDYCRLIRKVDSELELKLTDFIMGLNIESLIRSFNSIQFSLSISNTLLFVRCTHVLLLLMDCAFLMSPFIMWAVICFSPESHAYDVYDNIENNLVRTFGGFKVYSVMAIISIILTVIIIRWIIETKDKGEITSANILATIIAFFGIYLIREDYIRSLNSSLIGKRFIEYLAFNLSVFDTKWIKLYLSLLILLTFGVLILYLILRTRYFIQFLLDGRWIVILTLDFWSKLIKTLLKRFYVGLIRVIKIFIIELILIVVGGLTLLVIFTYLSKFSTYILATFAIGAIAFFIKDTGQYIFEKHRINVIKNKKKIDRVLLENEIDKLKHESNKCYLLEQLMKNGVELTGEWKNHKRPFIDNEKIDLALAKIDSSRLASYYYLF